MKELTGRSAIVTGASRGIGAEIARTLAREGMRLALVARSADAISQLADELSRSGASAVGIPADLADASKLDGMLERAKSALGAIDVLINNAGIDAMRPYSQESEAETRAMIELDLIVPMLLTRKVLPEMLARKSGHIVNLASLAGKAGTPYCVSYSSAKAGLLGFTHSLRSELSGSGVSVSAISPGFIRDEGMFAKRMLAHGVEVSKFLGTSRAEHVARAVLRILRDDQVELIVNPGPMRLMQVLQQLAPEAMSWLQARIGLNDMLHTLAHAQAPANSEQTERGRRSA